MSLLQSLFICGTFYAILLQLKRDRRRGNNVMELSRIKGQWGKIENEDVIILEGMRRGRNGI